jgi:hypothetical protein
MRRWDDGWEYEGTRWISGVNETRNAIGELGAMHGSSSRSVLGSCPA